MSGFTHKGYGRIYCETPDDVQRVHAVIKEMDGYEFGYMPTELVAPFSDYPRVVYVHKFSDLDMDAVTATCWSRGIRVWVFDSGRTEYPSDGRLQPQGD